MDGIILYKLNYANETVQVIVIASDAPLVTVEKTVRHSIVPPELAEKIPASTTEPVPVPAGKVATYSTESSVTVVVA
jgi:hypothetical protein